MRKSRLSLTSQERLIEHFVARTTARCAAEFIEVNRNTEIYYFHRLRVLISIRQKQEASELFEGEIKVNESYFSGIRKGKRGHGAAGKIPVFDLLKRGGKVYMEVIPDTKSCILIPLIRKEVEPDSIVYTDSFRSYSVLDVSEFKHDRINHSKLFALD